MGASWSESSIDVVNNAAIEACLEASNTCSAVLEATQEIEHSGFGLFTGASQKIRVNLKCLQDIRVDNTLLASMAAKIQQAAEAKSVALLPSFSGAKNTTNLRNFLSTKISQKFVQNCTASVQASQKIRFGGAQIGVLDSQELNLFTECMARALNNNNVAQSVVQAGDQTSSSSNENPLDAIGKAFSGVTGVIVAAIIGFIILIIIISWLLFGSSKETQVVMSAAPPPELGLAIGAPTTL